MKQAGFCVEGRGELGLIHVIFCSHNSEGHQKKQIYHCFSIITNALDTSHE
jgi:hypothetical protein